MNMMRYSLLMVIALLIVPIISASPSLNRFEGNVTIDGATNTSSVDNATVIAYINGAKLGGSSVGGESTVGYPGIDRTPSYYVISPGCVNGDTVGFKINGVWVFQANRTCSQGSQTLLNLTMNKSVSGAACTYGYTWSDSGCASGLTCCSTNACASSCSSGSSGSGGGGGGSSSGSSGSSGGGGGGGTGTGSGSSTPAASTPETPAATFVQEPSDLTGSSKEGVVVTPTNVPVTDLNVKRDLLVGLASDLGLTDTSGNVFGSAIANPAASLTVVESAAAEQTVAVTSASVDVAAGGASSSAAQSAFSSAKAGLGSGNVVAVPVDTKLQVLQITSSETGKTVTVSKVTLHVAATEKDLVNINVIETVPKTSAATASEITYLGEKPVVLQEDPILQWSFDRIKKGESKDLSYVINKKLDRLDSKTVVVAQATPTSQGRGNTLMALLGLVIVLVVGAALYFFVVKKR
ncbi:hypothetical protein HZB02_00210 [Candidatus Woesearchaeota archaeon]|nr:hypothetical protein [Candidatus Woesearchaeota archaeon]